MSSDGYDIISHYQKSIKKARNNETKLLHCLGKLFDLPITIDHLQRTGVGKTVNSLRKYNGEVGTAAKTLVAKWKAMVATGEIVDKEETQKVMFDKFASDNMQEIKNESSSTNNISVKQSINESKSIPNNSHNHNQRKSHHRDKDTGISTKTVLNSKHNNHNERNHKESREKDKNHRSRHDDRNKLKPHSTSSKNVKGSDIDVPTQYHQNNAMSNGNVALSDSSEKRNKKSAEDSVESISPKAKKAKIVVDGGIDCSMGASFSDALGMCSLGSNKKQKKLQKSSKGTKVFEDMCDQNTINNNLNCMPDALKSLPQSKIDISFNLPLVTPVLKITDNYKPAPINQNVMNCIYPSTTTEKASLSSADALCLSISSKTMRTKVYSGVKTGAILNVPSLFDICIRVLQKNIDALEYTGGVPFDVLRPVLERTTPQQLLSFEDYNAYLLEDTDVLWQQHVGRHFRGKVKEEGETWREMFLRCEDEKEMRLSILTKNIKISQKQSALPVRKTRLAYVDNVVKPPRNILRKQEQYGTNDIPIASPAARVAALTSGSHNTVKAGDPRLKNARDTLQAAGNQLRAKKAPLMAKTLQFIKKRYKR